MPFPNALTEAQVRNSPYVSPVAKRTETGKRQKPSSVPLPLHLAGEQPPLEVQVGLRRMLARLSHPSMSLGQRNDPTSQ